MMLFPCLMQSKSKQSIILMINGCHGQFNGLRTTADRENIFQFEKSTSDHRSRISKKELLPTFPGRQKVPLFRHLIVHLGHLSPEFCGTSLFLVSDLYRGL